MGSGDLTRAEFERVVREALDSLPKRFADMVENVVIAVEEEPNREDLESFEHDDDDDDATKSCWASTAASRSPSARTTCRCCPTRSRSSAARSTASPARAQEAVDEVRETVIHELGHYFGLGDDEMPH